MIVEVTSSTVFAHTDLNKALKSAYVSQIDNVVPITFLLPYVNVTKISPLVTLF